MPVPPMGLAAEPKGRISAGSGPTGQEARDALLEHLVPDRGHVVAIRNLQRLAGRQQSRQLRRGAADHVLAADRDQRRDADRGDLCAREPLARAAHAGRERPQVGSGLLGKGAKQACPGIAHRGQRRGFERFGDAFRNADAVHEFVLPSPPKTTLRRRCGLSSARKAAIRAPME